MFLAIELFVILLLIALGEGVLEISPHAVRRILLSLAAWVAAFAAGIAILSALVVGFGLKPGLEVRKEDRPGVLHLLGSGFTAMRNPRIALAFSVATLLLWGARRFVDGSVAKLDVASTPNREAVQVRAGQVMAALKVVIFGGAAITAVSLAASLRGRYRERTHDSPPGLPGKK